MGAQLKLHTGGAAPVSQVVPGQSSGIRQVIVQRYAVDEGNWPHLESKVGANPHAASLGILAMVQSLEPA